MNFKNPMNFDFQGPKFEPQIDENHINGILENHADFQDFLYP